MSTHATRIDVEEIEVTRMEKLLAVVLTAFFLVGGIWAYTNIDDLGRSAPKPPQAYLTASERAAVDRAADAQQRLAAAETAAARAREDLELAREAYRTALDAGRPAPALEAAYGRAQQRFEVTQRAVAQARAEASAAQPGADAAYRRAGEEALEASRQSELVTFLLRLGLVFAVLGAGYWLLVRLRRVGSRYVTAGFALVAFATLLALVMAGDYLTDYIDVLELGPLVLSLVGIVSTLAVFWWLQRYLARRIPQRRVRRGECPFCGYPVGGGEHCEGCGRAVVGACTTCHEPRRVGTFHCAACGSA